MRTKQQIRREAQIILDNLATTYPILHRVPIRVSSRMTRTAGKAVWKSFSPYEIVLSLPFFADESNDLHNTVTHEAAHLVAGYNAGHGYDWKMIHERMGGNAREHHTMSLAEGFKRATRVEVTCPRCGLPMSLGPTQAKKAARGVRYTHGRCRGRR